MTETNLQIWVAIPMAANILMLLFVLLFLRRTARKLEADAARKGAAKVMAALSPMLQQAQETAGELDRQLREKQRIMQDLNETLDRRIASLNLLVNRADATLKATETRGDGQSADTRDVVLDLYERGVGADQIAEELSMRRGEVDLILELKRKLEGLAATRS